MHLSPSDLLIEMSKSFSNLQSLKSLTGVARNVFISELPDLLRWELHCNLRKKVCQYRKRKFVIIIWIRKR